MSTLLPYRRSALAAAYANDSFEVIVGRIVSDADRRMQAASEDTTAYGLDHLGLEDLATGLELDGDLDARRILDRHRASELVHLAYLHRP